jgi:hypothetical protein
MQKYSAPRIFDEEGIELDKLLGNFDDSNRNFHLLKSSEVSISEEETSCIIKNQKISRNFNYTQKPNFGLDISSIHPSPNKELARHMEDLKNQIFSLSNKFVYHQNDLEVLAGENICLRNRIIKLQQNLISLGEISLQEKSKCKCSIF